MFISKSNEIKIDDESRCFVIAEVGINHNGSLKEALKYLDLVKKVARKSLVYSQNLEKGTKIELKHLGALRPSSGLQISEFNSVFNKSLKRSVKKNEVINFSDFKN